MPLGGISPQSTLVEFALSKLPRSISSAWDTLTRSSYLAAPLESSHLVCIGPSSNRGGKGAPFPRFIPHPYSHPTHCSAPFLPPSLGERALGEFPLALHASTGHQQRRCLTMWPVDPSLDRVSRASEPICQPPCTQQPWYRSIANSYFSLEE